ncbi:hypothetical protein FA13DRAFT_1727875 [Coprinellus micaceus]|uniref:NYN domain-containing protein n=1 Tax=Coprinellus micaceus TaxID=71717 RepID=A0A4Y7TQX5_COPMI|nr:hypothetical protein FA13DRAFT_1727875 [Coprinellus micaceus]
MLISGDRDFSYALSILRLRRYRVALVTPPNTHISLTAQASHHLHWTSDVLDASTNTPVKPPKKEPPSPTRVISPPRVNFSSATPLARRNTDASFSRDRTTPSSTSGLLAPPTSGFSTDPEQTLAMGENSKRREARGRFRSLGNRGQSTPSIAVDDPPQSPRSPKREAVTSFFGTPFRLPRTPPTRFETQSFSQFSDRKGKSRESAPPSQAPRNGTAYARVRSPLVEAVNAPLPQSPVSDGYQESEGHSGSTSERPPSSDLGGEYDNDIPWESSDHPPSEPLSPCTDLGNSARQFEDSSGNTDSIVSAASGSGSPMQSSRMPDGTLRRVVPFRFKPLVLQLQDCRRDGSYIPPRSLLIERMDSRFQPVERIYQNAEVGGFDEYIELAEQEGFVTTGGGDGPVEAWIMLRQEWVGSIC